MASLAGAAITLQIRAAGLGVGPAKSAARNLTARGEGPGLTFLPTFTRNNGKGIGGEGGGSIFISLLKNHDTLVPRSPPLSDM
jgi:hypothetical protein